MPPAKKSYRKKRVAPKKRVPMKKRSSKKGNAPEYASLSCKRTLALATGNQIYSYDNVNLADFSRAVQVAEAYQRYKITNIAVTWKPVYDTYSSTTLQQKPSLYYMIDKSSSLPDNVTLEGLKQAGAKPRAFDEKPITVSWAPSVLQDNLGAAGGSLASGYRVSPILSTNANPTAPGAWNASTIAHGGIKWYMETPGVVQSFNMEIEVQFQFFKPMFPSLGTGPALGLTYAILDASPDGVEGGTDGITIPLHS